MSNVYVNGEKVKFWPYGYSSFHVDVTDFLTDNGYPKMEKVVKTAGKYRASANGDPTCLDLFHMPQMHAFNGMLTVIVQAGEQAGDVKLNVQAKGVRGASIILPVVK